jgi:high affinity Mn2+ porin
MRKILKKPTFRAQAAGTLQAVVIAAFLSLPCALLAQAPPVSSDAPPAATMFPHTTTAAFWLAGQANIVAQGHGPFHSPYSGENSLRATSEHTVSQVLTIYSGYQLTRSNEVLLDLESAGGRGISDAFGLGGFTDLDVVRNPTLGAKPYIARLMFHHVIAFGTERESQERGPLSIITDVPVRRLDLRIGKLGTVDFFDLNSVGSDSHLQFLNWTVDNNGAFDYAADTRGYTIGAVAEYHDRGWSARAGVMLMPAVANGIKLDTRVGHARGENLELEWRPTLLADRATAIRLLLYENYAHMGSYDEAIAAFRSGVDARPNITAHEKVGRTKYGVGLNGEQQLTANVRAFGRLGWSDGRNESFAYTEVDRTAELGVDWKIPGRLLDKVGLAIADNHLSGPHREYLRLGGLGFLLGDGTLRYGPERIIEAYYTAHIFRGLFASIDLQSIQNPGYNRDRGPVLVPTARLHIDF